ncbi:secreted RxLR effector protein 161-like [Rutidosis leptorrhynchoides]|uniref:secreted RxLR effector protein 161-like n=1 Tax=Rutidosis leptorrhynchoides TaxID=125765 RepID=UPI003A990A22
MVKTDTIRVLFSIAANEDWPLHQFDVKNAFLHGELKEKVYMEAPPGMTDCKPVDTPMIPNQKLYMDDETGLADKGQYQRMVGKLIYLVHTRPDIAHAVGVVSQFMQQPHVHHMEAVIRIIRYLKKTADHGVIFKRNEDLRTQIYTDASWAGEKGDRKSTSEFFTLVGGNLVAWRSKKQKVVSLSSADSEFRGIEKGVVEALWIKKLLTKISFPPNESYSNFLRQRSSLCHIRESCST